MIETVIDSGIYTVDANYVKPQLASIHILREGDSLAIIDTGTCHSVPLLGAAINKLGLTWDAVKYVIVTHVHLDHAGGAGAILNLAHNAKLVVHPLGSQHMISPAKLIAGSIAVYGEEQFLALYGEVQAIEAERVHIAQDNSSLLLEQRELRFIDTPGHARHHFCVWDEKTKSMFTGDTLGVGYLQLRAGDRAFLMLSTTPVQFDPDALSGSIARVMKHQPKAIYTTHFGHCTPSPENIENLAGQISDYVRLAQECAEHSATEAAFQSKLPRVLHKYSMDRAHQFLPELDEKTIEEWTELDATLNAQGLAIWWNRANPNYWREAT